MKATIWIGTVAATAAMSLALRGMASGRQENAMATAKEFLAQSNQDKEVLLALSHASKAVAYAQMALERGMPAKKLLGVCRKKERMALEYAKKSSAV